MGEKNKKHNRKVKCSPVGRDVPQFRRAPRTDLFRKLPRDYQGLLRNLVSIVASLQEFLLDYGQHLEGCPRRSNSGGACTCGFSVVLDAVVASREIGNVPVSGKIQDE